MYTLYLDSIAASLGNTFNGTVLHAIVLLLVLCIIVLLNRNRVEEYISVYVGREGIVPFFAVTALFIGVWITLFNLIIMILFNALYGVFSGLALAETFIILGSLVVVAFTVYKLYVMTRITIMKEKISR